MKFTSKVIQGVQLGSKFGIATANLELSNIDKNLNEGVYIVEVFYENKTFGGILHYGARKTFGGEISAEVHILSFEKNIYEENLTIQIFKFLRKTHTFQNADQLFTQIETDITKTEKYFLRKKVFKIWKNLTEKEKNNLAKVAFSEISEAKDFLESENILIYAPEISKEINFTDLLMEFFPEKNYFFPKVENKDLNFYLVKNYTDLKSGKFNILEPKISKNTKKINFKNLGNSEKNKFLVIIPAVAGDENLNRLGRGGGFYDKFLTDLKKYKINFQTLLVIPEFALFEHIPTEKHDQKVDEILAV